MEHKFKAGDIIYCSWFLKTPGVYQVEVKECIEVMPNHRAAYRVSFNNDHFYHTVYEHRAFTNHEDALFSFKIEMAQKLRDKITACHESIQSNLVSNKELKTIIRSITKELNNLTNKTC